MPCSQKVTLNLLFPWDLRQRWGLAPRILIVTVLILLFFSVQQLSDTNRIGKFGLGMNSAYHYTDVLSFVSADSLVVFDPHGKRGSSRPPTNLLCKTHFLTLLLTGLPNRVLGARAKLQSVWEQTPDMLTPYALSDLSESSKTFTQTLPKDW